MKGDFRIGRNRKRRVRAFYAQRKKSAGKAVRVDGCAESAAVGTAVRVCKTGNRPQPNEVGVSVWDNHVAVGAATPKHAGQPAASRFSPAYGAAVAGGLPPPF